MLASDELESRMNAEEGRYSAALIEFWAKGAKQEKPGRERERTVILEKI